MPLDKFILKRFPNPVFIETGTFMGDGILHAIDAGFKKIYSIERSDYYYTRAFHTFRYFDNVCNIYGDSGDVLPALLANISVPITFWLDAHYSEQGTYDGPSPLFKELNAIRNHHIKNHTILIDDMSDYDMNDLVFEILKMDEPYQIDFYNNILICQPLNC